MDAVILAAGRGERVRDVAPPFFKPLIEVDGVPLVRRHVQLAIDAGTTTPVVVVAAENAYAIDRALEGLPARLVIQREPLGPGHALLIGLCVEPDPFQSSDRVLVLLSDNVVTETDVAKLTGLPYTGVGVREVACAEAYRFTRLEGTRWVEREPLTDETPDPVPCWVGPFVGWRQAMMRTLRDVVGNVSEALIGPYLNELTGTYARGRAVTVPVSSYDIGTPEAYRATITERTRT